MDGKESRNEKKKKMKCTYIGIKGKEEVEEQLESKRESGMRKVNGKQNVIEDERNERNKRNRTELKGAEKVGNGKGKGKEVRKGK